MGIAKIRNRHPQNSICVKEGFYLSEVEEQPEWEFPYNAIVGFDDYDFVESNSECVAFEDQLISIPYDLYCLPDLKEILSLDIWNTCLNEEERFKLSAFLPDLDQQTFWLTLKELLNGENVFFGSPLLHFFHRLKGGFYSWPVLQNWEVLQALEKRKYYHCLRSYHEKMTQVFKDMQKIWGTCFPGINVEERLQIWKKQKGQLKPVFSVDLNAPPDDDIFLKGERGSDAFQSIKQTRCSEYNKIYNGVPIKNPRGVLKIKPVKESAHTDLSQSLPCNYLAMFRPHPKGVLKLKSKSCKIGLQDTSRSMSLNSNSMPSTSSSLLHSHKFPLASLNSKLGTNNFYGSSEFANSEVSDEHSCRTNVQYWETPRGERPFPIVGNMELQDFGEKYSMNMKVYCRRTNSSRHKNSGTNSHNSVLERRHLLPSVNSRFPTVNNTGLGAYNLNSSGKDLSDGCLAPPALACLAAASEVAFPITYKRKKPYLNQNSLSVKHAVHYPDRESRTLQKEGYGSLQNSQNM